MLCLLYEPAALISNKADCPYCGALLLPFCDVSALTLQNGCSNARYVYFIGVHRRTRFVRHRKRVVSVADRWGTHLGYCSRRDGARNSG